MAEDQLRAIYRSRVKSLITQETDQLGSHLLHSTRYTPFYHLVVSINTESRTLNPYVRTC